MNKTDLVSSVAKTAGFKIAEAEKAVDAVFEAITNSLKQGDDVRLLGFGTFAVVKRPETEGRNPRTGEKITIAEKIVAKFKPGKGLKDAISA